MVLFISYSAIFGGAERQLVDFATALEQECCVACPEGPLAQAARRAGMRVFPLRERPLDVRSTPRDRLFSVPRLVAYALEARRLVRSLRPELTVAWGMRPALAVLAGRAAAEQVVFQHIDMLPGPLIGALVRAAAARTDLVVANSEAVARDLDRHGRLGSRLQVVHPGVDVGSFGSGPVPAGPPQVLVLGALVSWKRPDLALDAFALVRAERPDALLRFVGAPLAGDGSLLSHLRERASAPGLVGGVELDGAVEDPRAALESATCLLHCADREPFGLAVLEALASGRPAVVPAAGGPAEIVDSCSGYLYPPGDAGAAADGILELLASPERAARMGAHGRARARDRFDRATVGRRFAAALAPLLRARGSGIERRAPEIEPATVAIVTVTHNSAPELRALLASIDRHLPGARVIVVDSASCDDSVAVARAWSGGAVVLALSENVGFGRACNRALDEVTEPITLLLNPDVELLDGSLLELAHEAGRQELPARLLAPLVLAGDGSRQDSVHPAPASPADLLRAVLPPAVLPARFARPLAPWRAERPRRVGWAVGCALAARTDTLRRLGPFDEQIFLYGEDLDLGLRAAAAGVQTWFWPAVRVLHHGAHTTHSAFGGEAFELLARARRTVVARRLGTRRARIDDAAQAVTFASRVALKRLARRPTEREGRQLAALASVRSEDRSTPAC